MVAAALAAAVAAAGAPQHARADRWAAGPAANDSGKPEDGGRRAGPDGAAAQAGRSEGERLYRRHCARCHGESGRGDGPDGALFDPPPRDLRTGFLERYRTEELVRRVREGLPLTLALDLPALRARAREVEAIAAHLARLPAIDWRRAEPGQELYVDHCEVCHGPFGRGGTVAPKGVRPPRDLADPAFQRSLGDEALIAVARHGRAGMPAIAPRLSEADGRDLVAFVRLLSPGFELYSRYCAACHGDDGRGAGSFVEAFRRPTVPFDRAYFTRRDPEEVRAAVWHMLADQKPAMPHLRDRLGEAEARAIVEYLKRAP